MTLKQERVLRTAIDCAKVVYGVDPLIKCRETSYVWSRRAIYVALTKSGLSHEKAGRAIGNRDHSTITVALKKHAELIEVDKEYQETYLEFKLLFNDRIGDLNRTINDVKESVLEFNYRIENELLGMGLNWIQIAEFWRSVSDVKRMNKSA